jgi:hypothetical protein
MGEGNKRMVTLSHRGLRKLNIFERILKVTDFKPQILQNST